MAITDANGNATPEILTALKLTVIPEKATRKHLRTIVVDNQDDNLTILDGDGATTVLPGRGTGLKKGDTIILLVQGSTSEGIGEQVRGLFKASTVADRLDRFTEDQADDPIKAALIGVLNSQREDAQVQQTAENAAAEFKEFVLSTVQGSQETDESATTVGETVSECAQAISGDRAASSSESATEQQAVADGCLTTAAVLKVAPPDVRITSPSTGASVFAADLITITADVVAKAVVASVTLDAGGSDREVLTQSPYTWNFAVPTGVTTLPVRVTAVDDAGQAASDEITLLVAEPPKVTVNITSPVAGTIAVEPRAENSRVSTVSGSSQNIQEGDTVLVRAEVSGTGSITVVFKIGGTAQAPITQPPYSMDYFVPFTPLGVTPAPLEIVATATDGAGNTATDSVTVTVDRKTTNVNVTITSPQSDASVKAGDTITISAETDDNSQIAFFTFSVDGVETIIMNAPFTAPRLRWKSHFGRC